MLALRMQAIALRDIGVSDHNIATRLGIGRHAVGAILYRADQQKARNERRKAACLAEKQRIASIEVPRWVKALDLENEYRDMAAAEDEFAAAAHCRVLKRKMGSSA